MQLHEALGHRLVEGVASVVSGQVKVIEGLLRAAAIDSDAPLVQNQADVAGDVLLSGLDERVEGTLQRGKPQTVVDLFRPTGVDQALVSCQLALHGDVFESLVCGDEDHGAGGFVNLTRLDADKAVLDHVESTDALGTTTAVELFDCFQNRYRSAIDCNRLTALEADDKLIRGIAQRRLLGVSVEILGRGVPEIFKEASLCLLYTSDAADD